ncbi:MAG: DUF6495 family protein [Bacteroidia bacterium]|nr:DUF6495 family protein [Bacteroidia bacterium]
MDYYLRRMKYERISIDELEKLEKEFIDFLVVNGISPIDWVSIKENKPLTADKIINQFSDVVWESILRSTKYLDKIENKISYFFECNLEEINLIIINKSTNKQKKTSKKYKKIREIEMFEMILSGSVISDGENYNKLK